MTGFNLVLIVALCVGVGYLIAWATVNWPWDL